MLQSILEDFQERVMAVGVTGVMLTDEIAIQHMLAKQTKGGIVNIASIAGRRPLQCPDYCVLRRQLSC